MRQDLQVTKDLIDRAQKAQEDLLDVVLKVFEKYPNRCLTAGPITKALGLFEGTKSSKNWLVESMKIELSKRNDFIKCPPMKGIKYNPHN